MLWGSISYNGTSKLCFFNGSVNSDSYIKTLKSHLLPFTKKQNSPNLVFQQDNAPCHISKKTKQFLMTANIPILDWPPNSPQTRSGHFGR